MVSKFSSTASIFYFLTVGTVTKHILILFKLGYQHKRRYLLGIIAHWVITVFCNFVLFPAQFFGNFFGASCKFVVDPVTNSFALLNIKI